MDEVDEEALRERLMDECGTAMFDGFPAALLDVADIESAPRATSYSKWQNALGLIPRNTKPVKTC